LEKHFRKNARQHGKPDQWARRRRAGSYLLRGKQLLSGVLPEGAFERTFDFQLERFRRFMTKEHGVELILTISGHQVVACAP
jgi:hypothetical protein